MSGFFQLLVRCFFYVNVSLKIPSKIYQGYSIFFVFKPWLLCVYVLEFLPGRVAPWHVGTRMYTVVLGSAAFPWIIPFRAAKSKR